MTIAPQNSRHADATGPESPHQIPLAGCAPTPLAHYLKALAILRIIAEQADPGARGSWDEDQFILQTSLDANELTAFFLNDYAPTPIVSPWNGGSGMKPNKTKKVVTALRQSQLGRFGAYRNTLEAAFRAMAQLGIKGKFPKKQKDSFLQLCRATYPDAGLKWLDAAVVLTNSGPKYPSLLGSGGNDGRLDFGINFMQRIVDVIDLDSGGPTRQSSQWLKASLFDVAQADLVRKATTGQFLPRGTGGANQSAGFDAKSFCNPWDFIFMLEGAVLFGAAAVKRLESAHGAAASIPFAVRHIGVGHGSADASEEEGARHEMWFPLWGNPICLPELKALLSEGRVRVGRRRASNSIEFARAIATLGVDRGISSFQRFGFQERNGRAYFATPLNRIAVARRPDVELLNEVDAWLDRFLSATNADNAPNAIQSAAHRLEETVFRLCQLGAPRQVRDVLVTLGDCERILAARPTWTFAQFGLRPLDGLSSKWVARANDGSPEFRLAATLASTYAAGNQKSSASPLRHHLEPIHRPAGRLNWNEQAGRDVVWHDGDPIDVLNQIMARRILGATKEHSSYWPDRSTFWASIDDITAFIEGQIDLRRLVSLLWALSLVNWSKINISEDLPSLSHSRTHERTPNALYGVTKLCFAGSPLTQHGDAIDIPITAAIHRQLRVGNSLQASRYAVQRLRASGLPPAIDQVAIDAATCRRVGAALCFSISPRALHTLQNRFIRRRRS